MGAEIDRLEVQIESKATKVNNSLDTLVAKLDRVSGALTRLNNGGLAGLSDGVVKFAQASAQLSNVKTADFTRLAKNIEKLSNLNTKELYGASHAMRTLANSMNGFGNVSGNSVGVAEFVSSISKLGGVNVQRAITNLPALGNAVNDLMTTLSKTPAVSNNVIQLTRALADLSAQGGKVGTATAGLNQSINSTGNVLSVNTKKAKGFASAIGSIYQKYFWVINGAKKLWSSIEGSMDYIETLNYFDAAFEQVAGTAVSQMESAGEASAKAYFESFSTRAKELTAKMTGYTVNEDGTLTATGSASLGIDPNKLMNYQATFAQMSSSMGVASETSLKLSQALTEIGADLASVKNMDFDKVWKDMASGLAGMSRTLDKYGVNIRNVNLQQKLLDLGIEENITNLNQNDKALLRAIILLDSTKYAWGDLAETLNQPANQLRLLNNNLSNLSRTVGNLFLPLVQKVLPYVNGLVISAQRLFTWIGTLMGVDLSEITSAVGSSEVDMSELLGDTDDLTDSLGDASDAAKKLKSNLQGFDELNVITTQTGGDTSGLGTGLSSGLLDAAFNESLAEYQKAWDEAFANMENRANDFADKVDGYFEPVRNLIESFGIGDFFKAGQDTSNLAAGIFDSFSRAIDDVEWEKIGESIGNYLKGVEWKRVFESVGNFIENGVEAAIDLWEGSFDAEPMATAIVTALGIAKFTGLDETLKDKIVKAFPKDITLTETIALTLPIALFVKTSTTEGAEKYLNSIEKLSTFDFENMEPSEWWDGILGFAGATVGLSGSFWANNTLYNDMLKAIPQREDYETLEEYNKALDEWMKNAEQVSNARFQIRGIEYDEKNWNATLAEMGDKISTWLDETSVAVWNWWNNDIVAEWDSTVGRWWNNSVTSWFTREKWAKLGENAKMGLTVKWGEFTSWWENTALYKWWNNDVVPFFSKDAWSWSGIKDGLTESFENAINSIKNLWNKFTEWLNGMLSFEIGSIDFGGKEVLKGKNVTVGKIPAFSIGGFPEDGLFMANHNELVGKFSNGRTAVANNEQIVAGIEYGVEQAVIRVLEPYLAEIARNTRETADKELVITNDTIGRGAKAYARDYFNRTGKPAY